MWEQDFGIPVDCKLSVVAKKANMTLERINIGINIPVHCFGQAVPGVQYVVLEASLKKDVDRVEWVQKRATEMTRSLKTKPTKEDLKHSGIFSLEKRRGECDCPLQVFERLSLKEARGLFPLAAEHRTYNNGFKLPGKR